MEIQYTWIIDYAETLRTHTDNNGNTYENVVWLLSWRLKGEYNGKEEYTGGNQKLNFSDLSNFNPLEKITKQMLLDWLLESIEPTLIAYEKKYLEDILIESESEAIQIKIIEGDFFPEEII